MFNKPTGLSLALAAAAVMPAAARAANPVLEELVSDRLSPGGAAFVIAGVPVNAFFLVVLLIASAAFVLFWLLMLVDCVKRHWPRKIVWLAALIISLPLGLYWLAAILYYFMVKRRPPAAIQPAAPKTPSGPAPGN